MEKKEEKKEKEPKRMNFIDNLTLQRRIYNIILKNSKYNLNSEQRFLLDHKIEKQINNNNNNNKLNLQNYKSVENFDYNQFIDYCDGQMRLFENL